MHVVSTNQIAYILHFNDKVLKSYVIIKLKWIQMVLYDYRSI